MPKILNLFLETLNAIAFNPKIHYRAIIVSNALSYLKLSIGEEQNLKQFAWPHLKQLSS